MKGPNTCLAVTILSALFCIACSGGQKDSDEKKSQNFAGNAAAGKFEHDNSIQVVAAPAAVHTNYFRDGSKMPDLARDPNFDAYTLWYFHCFADFQTADEKVDDTSGAATVKLKVKAVNFRLSCPVNIWLDKSAPILTREHEDGHVLICRKVYELAPNVARAAGEEVLGKSYNGMGANIGQARKMAQSLMERDVAAVYREKVVELCDEISTQYDTQCTLEIEKHSKLRQHDLAEQSFRETVDRQVTTF